MVLLLKVLKAGARRQQLAGAIQRGAILISRHLLDAQVNDHRSRIGVSISSVSTILRTT
jgi:hypothetical protein